MLTLQGTSLRSELTRDTVVVFSGRVKYRRIRTTANVDLGNLETLALAEQLHSVLI